MYNIQWKFISEGASVADLRYPDPYRTPVKDVKLIISINQADRASILRGISPKNDPP
jgi:hypothetical protein